MKKKRQSLVLKSPLDHYTKVAAIVILFCMQLSNNITNIKIVMSRGLCIKNGHCMHILSLVTEMVLI